MTSAAAIPATARARPRNRRGTNHPTRKDSGIAAATIPSTTHSVVVGGPSIWMLPVPVSA